MTKYQSIYKKGGYDIEWKDVLFYEDKIMNMIYDIYHIKYIQRTELDGCYGIKITIKHNNINYDIIITKRDEDIGFSINNADDYEKINYDYVNMTIKNDKKCIYTIFKIILKIIE
jgi:hypothetical protein